MVENRFEVMDLIPKNTKRIASLDFQRGLAIWLMTFLHAFEHVYDYTWVKDKPEKIFELPKIALVVGIIIGFFASWNAYFLLISSIVNSLSMTKKVATGQSAKKILLKQVVTGAGIVFVGYFTESFGYTGYFGNAIRYGSWGSAYPILKGLFSMFTLQIIGYSMIITAVLHYFLIRKDGFLKFKRNLAIYGFLSLFIIVASPFLHNWVDSMNWDPLTYVPPDVGLGDNNQWPSIHFQTNNASFRAWLLTLLAGDMEPLFPYLATSFVGSMVGLSLARPKTHKRLPLIGGSLSLLMMILGGVFLALGFFTMGNNRPQTGNFLLMLGGQLGVVFFLLHRVEYKGRGERFANKRIVKHFRLWGMISLSVYCLAIFELFPRWVIGSSYNLLYSSEVNLLHSSLFGLGEEYKAILVAVLVILSFEALVYAWSKRNFKFSYEWCIIKLQGVSTKLPSNRLNVDYIMNNAQWANYLPEDPKKLVLATQIEPQPIKP
ncbi:MAG: hypothetical protein ACTSO7_03510 [Candidatus Heimdallarchaeota archaeon]